MKLPKLSRSPRHTIEKEDDSLIITIKSRRSIGTLAAGTLLLLLWAFMFIMLSTIWTIMMMGAKETAVSQSEGINIFIFISCALSVGLLYLLGQGIYAIYGFIREIVGRETIIVNKGQVIVDSQLFNWKREKEFPLASLEKVVVRNTYDRLSSSLFRKQYRYAFEINQDGKTHKFGYYVKEDEAKEILSAIHAFIS